MTERLLTAREHPTLFSVDEYDIDVLDESCWPCQHCAEMPLPKPGLEHLPHRGADPCLGWLSDVAHACCGHGKEQRAYVVISPACRPSQSVQELPDAKTLSDADALDYFSSRGVGPPPAVDRERAA